MPRRAELGTKTYSLVLDEEVMEKLAAADPDLSKSQVVRRALREYLAASSCRQGQQG